MYKRTKIVCTMGPACDSDDKIREMIASPKPVLFDCRVTKEENCFPMIPSGKAHNEMIMAEEARDLGSIIDDAGKRLV